MRQVMLMISKGTRRLPTVRDLESRGILVSSAVDKRGIKKIEEDDRMPDMTTAHCAKKYMSERKTDESRL